MIAVHVIQPFMARKFFQNWPKRDVFRVNNVLIFGYCCSMRVHVCHQVDRKKFKEPPAVAADVSQ